MSIGDKKSMTKKKWFELQRKYRVTNGFNTGTRDMATEKMPTRAKRKRDFKKELDNTEY
jgi:hypothetical protein